MGRHTLLSLLAATCLGQEPPQSWARLSWSWRMVAKLDKRKWRVGLSGQQGRRTGSLLGRGDPGPSSPGTAFEASSSAGGSKQALYSLQQPPTHCQPG